ncbi:MAG: hypothetical protein Q9221_006763 [Calogaya cf. arnoldii]
MASQPPKIAFAGLGAMGYGMATHLLKSGYAVTGFDVYQPALDRFLEESPSAAAAKTPKQAAQDVDFFICMVANSIQATPLLFDSETGAVNGLKEKATIIMCSTVAPAYIDELKSRLKDAGRSDIRLIDSPVSGGAGRAAEGTLSIFASGAEADLENAKAILESMSGKLYEIPGGLGGGSKAKLVHQIFAGINIAMSSEAMGLAAAAGLDTKEVFQRVSGSEATSWMFENRVPHMLDPGLGRYSAMTIIAKDVGIITTTSRAHQFPLPLLSTAEQLYLTAITQGWGAEDDCVLVRLYLPPSKPNLVATQAAQSPPSQASSKEPSTRIHNNNITWETIRDLMLGVHTASITEAMSFCEYLGIDIGLMYDIVSNAAGNSQVFKEYFTRMREKGWGIAGLDDAEGIKERLGHPILAIHPSHPIILAISKEDKQRLN